MILKTRLLKKLFKSLLFDNFTFGCPVLYQYYQTAPDITNQMLFGKWVSNYPEEKVMQWKESIKNLKNKKDTTLKNKKSLSKRENPDSFEDSKSPEIADSFEEESKFPEIVNSFMSGFYKTDCCCDICAFMKYDISIKPKHVLTEGDDCPYQEYEEFNENNGDSLPFLRQLSRELGIADKLLAIPMEYESDGIDESYEFV